METTPKKSLPCYLALMIITLAAGLVLGATYMLTKAPIEEQTAMTAANARTAVLPSAVSFVEAEAPEGFDWLYEGYDTDGNFAGYAAQKTANGFGGEIEIILGTDPENVITGLNVGGSNFSETAGLGAKSKEPAFTEQFIGKVNGIGVKKAGDVKGENDIDAITSATVTSTAVTRAINEMTSVLADLPLPAADTASVPAEEALTENAAEGGTEE